MRRRLATLLALTAVLALPPLAHASDVIVQGTTDVRDSGLLDDVIIPGLKKAYPQYNLKYIAVGTGQALANAEAGQGDAVLVHAPTSEKVFVAAGYSAERSGRAVFHSDYVIVGPKDDPAHVRSRARHNTSRAFELIAAAAAAGKANFVSRGDDSGTNVEEKLIWGLTNVRLTSAGEPRGGSGTGPWYRKANTGQGPTVQVTDQCRFSGGGCYGITDRGTFSRLLADRAITNLQVVSDRNAPGAPGGVNLLLNSFHAYAINPRKVKSVNLAGAKAFLDFLTSRAFQTRLATYPNAQQPSFIADALPAPKRAPAPAGVTHERKGSYGKQAFELLRHGDSQTFSILWLTLRVAFESTLLALAIGLPIGLWLGLGAFRGRRLGQTLFNAGLGLPPVVVGLVTSLLLFRQGPLGGLHLIYTVGGVVLAQTLLAVPIVAAFTASSVQAVPVALRDQARALGASRLRVAALAAREARIGIVAATIAAVGSALSEVGAVVLVGGNIQGQTQTLASAVLVRVEQGDYGRAIAIGVILMGLILLVAAGLTFAQQRGNPWRPTQAS
jgi:tungstate transport system permease protein